VDDRATSCDVACFVVFRFKQHDYFELHRSSVSKASHKMDVMSSAGSCSRWPTTWCRTGRPRRAASAAATASAERLRTERSLLGIRSRTINVDALSQKMEAGFSSSTTTSRSCRPNSLARCRASARTWSRSLPEARSRSWALSPTRCSCTRCISAPPSCPQTPCICRPRSAGRRSSWGRSCRSPCKAA
jgi:hypothetical protein